MEEAREMARADEARRRLLHRVDKAETQSEVRPQSLVKSVTRGRSGGRGVEGEEWREADLVKVRGLAAI